jgi:transketolase
MSTPVNKSLVNNYSQPPDLVSKLARIANRIRMRDLEMVFEAKAGHIGGDLSCIDILTTLYFHVLRYDPDKPTAVDRDRFVLSKGHCAGALYVTLAEAGFIDRSELSTFLKPNSRLNGHPNSTKLPGVETSTGPLGHGLPVSVGMALAARMFNASWRTYVLTGDGELQEGSNWEAAMAAAEFELDNLTLIIDRNRLQQGARTEETNSLEPLADKWRAFGWSVAELDGHDFAQLIAAISPQEAGSGRPRCIIAHTNKGEGVSFMRDRVEWHHRVPSASEYEQARRELLEHA